MGLFPKLTLLLAPLLLVAETMEKQEPYFTCKFKAPPQLFPKPVLPRTCCFEQCFPIDFSRSYSDLCLVSSHTFTEMQRVVSSNSSCVQAESHNAHPWLSQLQTKTSHKHNLQGHTLLASNFPRLFVDGGAWQLPGAGEVILGLPRKRGGAGGILWASRTERNHWQSCVLNAVPTALAFMPKLHLCKVLTHSTHRHKQREEYLPGERFHSNRVFMKPQDRDSLGEGKEVLQRHLFSFYEQKESSTFFFSPPLSSGTQQTISSIKARFSISVHIENYLLLVRKCQAQHPCCAAAVCSSMMDCFELLPKKHWVWIHLTRWTFIQWPC